MRRAGLWQRLHVSQLSPRPGAAHRSLEKTEGPSEPRSKAGVLRCGVCLLTATAALLIAAAALGASSGSDPLLAPSGATEEPPSARPTAERYLSEYTGIIPDWRPESEVDLSPPADRGMIIWEVSRFPDLLEPTPEQRRAADELLAAARTAVRENGWDVFENALLDGFELMFEDQNHYFHRDHITDGRVLDPERPEFLIYYDTGTSRRLAGLMFLVGEPGQEGPQIGGPATLWHFHVWSRPLCLWRDLLVSGWADEGRECVDGTASHRSPEMLHLWFFDHHQGRFATGMDLEPWQIRTLDEIEF